MSSKPKWYDPKECMIVFNQITGELKITCPYCKKWLDASVHRCRYCKRMLLCLYCGSTNLLERGSHATLCKECGKVILID